MRAKLLVLALAFVSPATAAPADKKAVIRRCIEIYKEPVDGKSHPCACAFSTNKKGGSCGSRAAHSRPSGAVPICLESEVTPELLKDFDTKEQAELHRRCAYHSRY